MVAWVLVSVLSAVFLTGNCVNVQEGGAGIDNLQIPKYFGPLKGFGVNQIYSAASTQNQPLLPASTNYVPYPTQTYHFQAEDAVDPYGQILNSYANNKYDDFQAGISESHEDTVREFNEDEDFQNQDFLGSSSGFKKYKTSKSYNLEGPHQVETINTRSYHKNVEPYGLEDFDHKHHGNEHHAEVHYHQHKHLHKHSHKQEHLHKHKGEHKHSHGHKHEHHGEHKHSHKSTHKHSHQGKHHHEHKGVHKHSHSGDHKHDHHHGHQHEHKHHGDHKHEGHHEHKHDHHQSHKHEHHGEHKHNHHHGHKHFGSHKHSHSAKHSHHHSQGHKHHKH